MSLIFPAGSKNHSWYPKLAENDNIGMDSISDEELAELANGDEDDYSEEGNPEELEGDVEVAEELDIDEAGEGDLASKIENAQQALDEASMALEEVAVEIDVDADPMEEPMDEPVSDDMGELMEDGPDMVIEEMEVMDPEVEGSTCCSCGAPVSASASTKGKKKVGASQRGLVPVAKLSPENKKRLGSYWKDMYGYAPEYVDAMLKDYE